MSITAASRPLNDGKKTSPIWAVLGLALLKAARAKAGGPATSVPAGRPSTAPQSSRAARPSARIPESRDAKSRSGRGARQGGASERERGREAERPDEVPAKGWKDIIWRTYEEINKDRILAVAAGVTFYGLLALFPAITALVSLYGLFADAATINDHLNILSGFLPGGATEVIGEQVKRITSKPSGTLGFAFFSSLAVSLWSANAGMKAIFDALNVAYGEDEKRSFIALNLRSLAFTLGAILFGLLALGGIVVVPVILNFIGLGKAAEWIIWIVRWPALLAVIGIGLAVLYRYGPSRNKVEWKWITPGSIFAAGGWLITSMLFSWYVSNFGSYNETYGSLGAVIGFMTWLWLSATIILIGAELNAEIEHQTVKDTTTGPPKELGERGAKVADTVGEAKV